MAEDESKPKEPKPIKNIPLELTETTIELAEKIVGGKVEDVVVKLKDGTILKIKADSITKTPGNPPKKQ